MGLAYYLNDRYALTTASLARNCMNAVCQTILGKKVQQVILHPKFTGSRDFNVALIVIPPATEYVSEITQFTYFIVPLLIFQTVLVSVSGNVT